MKKVLVLSFLLIFYYFGVNTCAAATVGDINNDGVVGLNEAIYALRNTAGLNPALPTGAERLTGTYIMNQIGVDPDHWTGRISMNFDGTGSVSWLQIDDSNDDTGNGSGSYDVAADGTLTVGGKEVGIVSSDGNIFSIADTDSSNSDLAVSIGIKKTTGASKALLTGTYIMNQIGVDPGHWTGRISMTFNGTGSVSWLQIDDSNGDTGSGSGSYDVAADGTLRVGGKEVGIVSSDGNIFSIADTDSSDSDLALSIGIKKTTGASKALLTGTYIMNQIGVDPDHWTGRISMTFNGIGSVLWQQIDDSNDDTGSGSGSYDVAADGTLTVDGKAVGIVSLDGKVFVMVDTDITDSDLALSIGIKKSV